jgi:beta-glucosidase
MADDLMPTSAVASEPLLGYRNPELPIEERVVDLLRQMTLEEKIAQMLCIWGQKKTILLDGAGHPDPAVLRQHLPHGIGQIARLGDTAGGLGPRETAELANAIQKVCEEETRLGIPVVIHEECLHGLAALEATSYPQPIGLASTFDPELVEEIYSAIARAARARGAHQALTPVVDVARDPRWGRVEETFGEDPYLISRMGIAAVRGFQGDRTFRSKDRVIATLKHFAAHGQPEAGMNCGPGNFSERELRDVFLSPFQAVLKNGKALSVMASYNEIDGVPSHANRWLLRDVLRGEWGFEGFVVSDYYGITELHKRDEATSHSVAGNKAEAAALAIRAGVNIELPDPDCYPTLLQLVRDGDIEESAIDELVAPLLRCKFMLGLFEDPYVNPDEAQRDEILDREQVLALRAARETITLLKNENGLLPLNRASIGTLAVIGPNADRVMLGGYTGTPPYCTTVLQGIRELVGEQIAVLHAEGCKITVGGSWNEDVVTPSDPEEDMRMIAEAAVAARKADVVILVLGGNEQTSREGWSRIHLGDRASLDLVGAQNDLVKAVMKAGKPVIALLFNGRPNSITALQNQVDAVLECWYLGQESGRAVAGVLFGDVVPGGKLPISIPRSVGHLPCFYNHKPSARRGYLFDDVTQLYPFGYGLSYTTFAFSNVRLEKPVIRVGETTIVCVDVKNVGTRPGDEVAQMYIRDLVSSVTRPVKELKGFKRIHLLPGESKTVAFTIGPEQLSFTNIDREQVVEPGEFEIMVGNSSRNQDLSEVVLTVLQR